MAAGLFPDLENEKNKSITRLLGPQQKHSRLFVKLLQGISSSPDKNHIYAPGQGLSFASDCQLITYTSRMSKSVLAKYVLPFFQWYAVMILAAIAIDYFLHRYKIISVGRYMGYVGTFTILLSFIYSLRKRKIIKSGSPKTLLALHEYMAWAGSIMILVHAGIHFNALLPWLAILMLLIAVATGLIGKFLLQRSAESLKERKQELAGKGMSNEDIDKQLFFDSVTIDLMKKWRAVHLPITLILGILALMHIITVIMFSK